MYSLVYKIKHLHIEAPSSKSIRSFSEQVTRVLRFLSLGLSSGIWQNVPGLWEALLVYLPVSRRIGSFQSSAKLSILQSAPVGVSGRALGSDGLGPGPGPSSLSSTSVSQRGPRAPVHLDLQVHGQPGGQHQKSVLRVRERRAILCPGALPFPW